MFDTQNNTGIVSISSAGISATLNRSLELTCMQNSSTDSPKDQCLFICLALKEKEVGEEMGDLDKCVKAGALDVGELIRVRFGKGNTFRGKIERQDASGLKLSDNSVYYIDVFIEMSISYQLMALLGGNNPDQEEEEFIFKNSENILEQIL